LALSRGNDAVLAAERRLSLRAVALHADWQSVKQSARHALAVPATIGVVALLGVLAGRWKRRSEPPPPAQPVPEQPSFVRVALLAILTPMVEGIVMQTVEKLVGAVLRRSEKTGTTASGGAEL
jgi:hypothetical protein